MTPDQERELDEWLAGLEGKTEPREGSGYDQLDARIGEALRSQDHKWRSELTELEVERAWSIVKRSVSRRAFPAQFTAGLAAGAVLALGATFTLQALKDRGDEFEHKGSGGTSPMRPAAAPGHTVVAADPLETATELAVVLERSGQAFSMNYYDGAYEVTWQASGTGVDPGLVDWLRRQGIATSAVAREGRLLIRPEPSL